MKQDMQNKMSIRNIGVGVCVYVYVAVNVWGE